MHLNDELMAQLIDGLIIDREREKYLKHISECRECFEVYTESIRSLESFEKVSSQKRFVLVILRNKRYVPWLVAAILLISMPFIWKAKRTSLPIQQPFELSEILVANGEQQNLLLEDGTRVLLDAGTSFKYPQQFKSEVREVFLAGEAYFEVSPDRERPFVVYAEHAVVKVLGTKFNIRAWVNTQSVKVAVVEGKVSLRSENADLEKGVLVSKGQMSLLRKNDLPSIPRKVNIDEHLGWMKRDLVFTNTPLKEILSQLERWYDIHFSLDDGISVSDQLTIHIQDRSIENILGLIAELMALEYKIEDQVVYLYLDN